MFAWRRKVDVDRLIPFQAVNRTVNTKPKVEYSATTVVR